jgi:hypothetical protein
MSKLGLTLGLASALVAVQPAAAAVVVSYNAGNNTTLPAPNSSGYAVETFANAPIGVNQSFAHTIGSATFSYSGVNIIAATDPTYGQYGNGTDYAAAYSNVGPAGATSSYHLDVTGSTGTYFGAYIGAADAVNTITFDLLGGGTYVYTPTGPNAPADQTSMFVNFQFTGGEKFTGLTFSTTGTTGFETDNHTVGLVPEPATWGLMLAGFGAIGGTLRRRRSVLRTA